MKSVRVAQDKPSAADALRDCFGQDGNFTVTVVEAPWPHQFPCGLHRKATAGHSVWEVLAQVCKRITFSEAAVNDCAVLCVCSFAALLQDPHDASESSLVVYKFPKTIRSAKEHLDDSSRLVPEIKRIQFKACGLKFFLQIAFGVYDTNWEVGVPRPSHMDVGCLSWCSHCSPCSSIACGTSGESILHPHRNHVKRNPVLVLLLHVLYAEPQFQQM